VPNAELRVDLARRRSGGGRDGRGVSCAIAFRACEQLRVEHAAGLRPESSGRVRARGRARRRRCYIGWPRPFGHDRCPACGRSLEIRIWDDAVCVGDRWSRHLGPSGAGADADWVRARDMRHRRGECGRRGRWWKRIVDERRVVGIARRNG